MSVHFLRQRVDVFERDMKRFLVQCELTSDGIIIYFKTKLYQQSSISVKRKQFYQLE